MTFQKIVISALKKDISAGRLEKAPKDVHHQRKMHRIEFELE